MQFVLNLCAFDQFAKPRPLCFRGGCEIEHDGDPFRQENANVWRECVLQSRVPVHECWNVGDLARKQSSHKVVLHEQDSVLPVSQLSSKCGFACCHLSAEKNQLR